MSGRGRGRGINNQPAWMTKGNDGGVGSKEGDNLPEGLPPPPTGSNDSNRPSGNDPEFDSFGRVSRDGGDDRCRVSSYNSDIGQRRGSSRGEGRERDRGRRGSSRNANGNSNEVNTHGRRYQLGIVAFRSYDEERDWVDDRRRMRMTRASHFDREPTPQQIAADLASKAMMSNPGATDFSGIKAKSRDFNAVPQQTRHARRLYIGHLPSNVTDDELHDFFRTSIEKAGGGGESDPILSVYVNHERRFCFLEFREVGMATACMALDGINVNGKGKVKVKRPNDYNPSMAPHVDPSSIPDLDVSKLGIISTNVQDGPNKLFIGGLHYHFTESQVMELLGAFGKIKSFHLVRSDASSLNSKGYCFVEYSDPASTPVAVMGLNGMDMGGGKVLTARIASQRGDSTVATAIPMVPNASGIQGIQPILTSNNGDPGIATIVGGYNIEELLDAAMGLKPMPTVPTHLDNFGQPITQISSSAEAATSPSAAVAGLPPPPPPQQQIPSSAGTSLPAGSSAMEIANAAQAALESAFGGSGNSAVQQPIAPPAPPQQPMKTRILVLLNMVTDEDLSTDEEYNALVEEVQDEVKKFGKLLSIQVPRKPTPTVEANAVGKIFLEYATTQDAANAEAELAGRQFGPNIVEANYFNEKDYASLRLH